MRTKVIARLLAGLVLFGGTLAVLAPAQAVEDALMGVRIGASYREIVRKFGHPVGILMNAGGGMNYQALPTGGMGAAPGGGLPIWAQPVQVAFLGNQQAEWLYDMRKARGVALGVVVSGEGSDAVVTDVVISGYPEYLKGKKVFVKTEKGVTFQASFATVLQKYGFPPQIEIFTPGTAPAPVVGGARGGNFPGGGGGNFPGGGGGGGPMGMRPGMGRGLGGGRAAAVL